MSFVILDTETTGVDDQAQVKARNIKKLLYLGM